MLDDRLDDGFPPVHGHGPGIVQQLTNDPVQTVYLLNHDIRGLAVIGVVPVSLFEIGREPLNGTQRIPDLMGHTGRQAAQGGQALALGDLLFQLLYFCNIPEENNHTARTILLFQHRGDHFQRDRPAVCQGAVDFFRDDLFFHRQRSEKIPAGFGQDVPGHPTDDFSCGLTQNKLGCLIEGNDPAFAIHGHQTHGHILHQVVGEGLDPGQ